jgi:hypothetical protein
VLAGCAGLVMRRGPFQSERSFGTAVWRSEQSSGSRAVNNIIYIVGLVVIVLAILAFLGLR